MNDLLELSFKAELTGLLNAAREKPLTTNQQQRLDKIRQQLTNAGAPAAGKTWPSQAAATRELGMSQAKLRGLVAKGCPAAADGTGIEQLPVYVWLWARREEVLRIKGNSAKDREQLKRLKIGNNRLEQKYIREAAGIVNRCLENCKMNARNLMSPEWVAEVLACSHDQTRMMNLISTLIENAIADALTPVKEIS
jgi:hypothetical protein